MKAFDYEYDREALVRRRKKRRIAVVLWGCALALLCALGLILVWMTGIHLGSSRKVAPPAMKPAVQIANFRFNRTPKAQGEAESLVKFADGEVLGARYPKMEDETLDTLMKEDAQSLIDAIEGSYQQNPDHKTVITMDYDIIPCGSYISVVYHVIQDFSDGAQQQHQVKTFLYDAKANQRLTNQDVFGENYPKFVSQYVRQYFGSQDGIREQVDSEAFQSATDPDWENFSHVSYTRDGVTIYFDAGRLSDVSTGVLSVTIPAKEIYQQMKLNVTGYTKEYTLPDDVDPSKPMIALTFDDGPYSPVGNRILDALEQVGGRATFFYLGNRVNDETSDVIKRAYGLHCEIGSHSYDHSNLTKLSGDDINSQLSKTDKKLKKMIGIPADVIRPPYGAVNDLVKKTVSKPIVTWSLDTLDWKTKNKDSIEKKILEHVEDGDIILMHELYTSTAEACESVIPKLAKEYQLVTVKELLTARGFKLENGKIYYHGIKK